MRKFVLPLMLIFCLCLAGCKIGQTDSPPEQETNKIMPNLPAALIRQHSVLNRDNTGGPLLRGDEEGLVEIRIQDGVPSVTFDLERWDSLHDIYQIAVDFGLDTLSAGPFLIEGLTGVRDVCIGKVYALDFFQYQEFVTPAAVFLMEDGSLEWLLLDIFLPQWEPGELHVLGPIPWLTDIVALSYESDGEGMGDMTIYAEDAAGLHYDLRIPAGLTYLYAGAWVCDFAWTGEYYGVLFFSGPDTLRFEKGWLDQPPGIIYEGRYKVSLAEEGEQRPGIISLDLRLEADAGGGAAPWLYGEYFFQAIGGTYLELWPSTGDLLHGEEGQGPESYAFWLGYSPFLSAMGGLEGEWLIEHLLANVPAVADLVMNGGMGVLISGETSYVPDVGLCQDIWLGTETPYAFTREILYAVADSGAIYEYDALGDQWIYLGGDLADTW